MTQITIDPASNGDLAEVQLLLTAAGLPTHGIQDLGSWLLVARDGEQLVGTIGLERYAEVGLLRSLAVQPELRGRGLGTRLFAALFQRARGQELERLFLLTLDAAPFFRRCGFVESARAEAPPELAASYFFTSGVCSTATCMSRRLD